MARDPLLRVLGRYAPAHLPTYLGGVLAMFATNWLTVTIPVEVGRAIDGLRAGTGIGDHALAVALMGASVIVVRTLSRVWFFNPGRDVEYSLRTDLFTHLLRLQPGFYAGQRTGDIVSRASNDLSFARVLVGFGIMQALNVTFALALTLWRTVEISPALTVQAFIPVIISLVVVQVAIRMLFDLVKEQQQQLGQISDHVLESFQGIATIQGFVAERAFTERFEARNAAWFETGMRLAVLRSLAFPLLYLAGGLSVFVILLWGGRMVLSGDITVGELVAFTTLLAALLPSLRSLGWMLSVIQRGRASLSRIFELMDAEVERPELTGQSGQGTGVVLPPRTAPGFVLRDLRFAYPDDPETEVLKGVSATLPAGGIVGIFGRTGSGKTTLLRVLSRLYNPPEGAVLVDPGEGAPPVDLRELDLDAWRDIFALAPQRPFLFSDSIRNNVALELAPDAERVQRAVSRAALDTDLEAFPQGLDTVVGERGIMLSGGQRQRSALARTLYRDAGVIALDDVLSAVDHETEARLVDTLRGLGQGAGDRVPTTLIVSHRLSAIRHADVILVLDEGRLVDQGTHAELAARPGLYRDTWQVQEAGARKAATARGTGADPAPALAGGPEGGAA